MATYKLLLLPGDGIGPEVMTEVKHLLAFLAKAGRAFAAIGPRWKLVQPLGVEQIHVLVTETLVNPTPLDLKRLVSKQFTVRTADPQPVNFDKRGDG